MIPISFVDQLLISGSNFVLSIILARQMGGEGFGVFAIFWTTIIILQAVQYAGISAPMMTLSAKPKRSSLYHQCLLIQSILSSICCIPILVASMQIYNVVYPDTFSLTAMAVASFTLVSTQLQDFGRRYLYLLNQDILAIGSDLIRYAGQLIALTVMTLAYPGTITFLTAMVCVAGSSFLASIIPLWYIKFSPWRKRFFFAVAITHWNFSKWLIGSSLIQILSGSLVIVAAGYLLGPAAAAVLRAGQTLLGPGQILLQWLEIDTPIRVAREYRQGGHRDLLRALLRTSLLIFPFLFLFTAPLCLFPDLIFSALYGTYFIKYSYVVLYFVAFFAFELISAVPRIYFRTIGNTSEIWTASLLSLIAAVLTLPLLPIYELHAAGVTLVTSRAIATMYLLARLKAEIDFQQGKIEHQ